MQPLAEIDNVHKWAGEGEGRTEILRGVSLAVHPGEYLAIMGASGSGKSTLLNILGLLDAPSAGTVRLLGRDTAHQSDDQLAELRGKSIGFIFQSFNLIPYLNVGENIELGLLYGHASQPARRAHELLGQVHLEERAKAYPATLSGGERQRVAIARALVNAPALILADEPTGALDSTTGAQIMDLIGGFHQSGTAVVLVTHDDKIAARAQKVLQMKDGRFT